MFFFAVLHGKFYEADCYIILDVSKMFHMLFEDMPSLYRTRIFEF